LQTQPLNVSVKMLPKLLELDEFLKHPGCVR
jgi:hypothetical protein